MKALYLIGLILVGCSKVNVTVEESRPRSPEVEHVLARSRPQVAPPPTIIYYVQQAAPPAPIERRAPEIIVAPTYRLSPLEAMTPSERERYFRELQILNPPVIYR